MSNSDNDNYLVMFAGLIIGGIILFKWIIDLFNSTAIAFNQFLGTATGLLTSFLKFAFVFGEWIAVIAIVSVVIWSAYKITIYIKKLTYVQELVTAMMEDQKAELSSKMDKLKFAVTEKIHVMENEQASFEMQAKEIMAGIEERLKQQLHAPSETETEPAPEEMNSNVLTNN